MSKERTTKCKFMKRTNHNNTKQQGPRTTEYSLGMKKEILRPVANLKLDFVRVKR